MALTPEGTPYVQSSDLVANYPAASLSLANRVDLVGVLPFATSTARGTAIPSPTDGQYTYLQDTNTTQFWNGSAWQTAGLTPGLNLVTPTSIANSGGSASLTGSAVTLSGVTSVSLNGVFTSTYENYRIIMTGTGTASQNLQMRFRIAGTDTTATNYAYQRLLVNGSTAGGSRTTSTQQLQVGGVATGWAINVLDLANPQMTSATTMRAYAGYSEAGAYMQDATGAYSLTTSFDGFTYFPDAGTISGIIRVYGYQN